MFKPFFRLKKTMIAAESGIKQRAKLATDGAPIHTDGRGCLASI
jgi:hypothetical protein